MKKIEETLEFGGRKLTLSTGHVAMQASGAVMVQYGETVALATVVASPLRVDLGYFPLTVEYQERLYAGGRIKGSRWVKREGRGTDEEILTGRLIDRSIRPLFPKGYKEDVQVMITVMSVDMENSPDLVGAVAASAALAISDVPWNGPIAAVRVGRIDGKLIVDPTTEELTKSDLDLVVSTTSDAIDMIEAGSREVIEADMIGAITKAQDEGLKIVKFIKAFTEKAGKKKKLYEYTKPSAELESKVRKLAGDKVEDLIAKMATKESGYGDYDQALAAVLANFEAPEKGHVAEVFENVFKDGVRKMILSGKRPDGRKHDEVRALSAGVGLLPRTHGSGIFQRGQTQVLTITTLGAPSLEQTIESAEGEETKRYIHHYSMPPYSTGETGKVGSPSRREIGHGALAERALLPVIPSVSEFPYTIRLVSEVLSSNGSTSMASVCGSSLSLMDAGVPIKAPVAGIAMGLIIESDKKFAVLSDIVGIEDGNGDMDFKVAGTTDGITALQLDVKTLNLTSKILEAALLQAKDVRMKILDVIKKAIAEPRKALSIYAPKIKVIKIDPEKIGELIGPGGKIIKGIIAKTGAQVDVDDTGSVFISSPSAEAMQAAVDYIEGMFKVPVAGEIYDGVVKRLQPFGAFVEILPGRDGLVHVSDMSMDFVKDPADLVKIGDAVKVRVKEIDELGRLNLSMLLDGDKEKRQDAPRRTFSDRPHRDDRFQSNRRYSNDRGDRGGRRQGGFAGPKGPHFPTSRLLQDSKKSY